MKTKEIIINNEIESHDTIDLRKVIDLFWKQKFLIIIITSLITLLSIFYSFLIKPEFTSESLFITRTANSGTGKLNDLAALTGISLSSANSTDPSDYLDQVLMDKRFLDELFTAGWQYNGHEEKIEKILDFKNKNSKPVSTYNYLKNCYDAIRSGNYIKLLKDKKNGIISLTTNFPDANLTKNVNQFCIDYLNNYMKNTSKSQAKEKRLFIEERLIEVKKDLENSENDLLNFRQNNMSVSSPSLILSESRLLRKVDINQEIYLQLQKQYELTKLEEMNDQTLIEVIRQPEIPISRSKPERKKMVMIGFVVGLAISFFSVLSVNWYRHNY